MATLATIGAFSRAQCETDSNGLTDVNLIIFANTALLDFHRRFISSGVDASQLQEAYRDTTAGVGTYLYPTDMFFLKAIELNYANSNAQDYKMATQVDVANLPGQTSFSWLRQNADKNTPQFDDHGDWYEIFPTPVSGDNTSQAIRIFYYLEPTEYTATTDTISYPVSLDYRTLGFYISSCYYQSLNKFDEADRFMQKYEDRMKQLIPTLSRGSQQPITATPLPISGWEF